VRPHLVSRKNKGEKQMTTAMTMNENNDPMEMMKEQFYCGMEGDTQNKIMSNDSKEKQFLNEISMIADKAEEELTQATFQLGQAALDPDKWSERNGKTLECNILKEKIKLIKDISEMYVNMFDVA
jgi:hypothetical protein